MLEKARKVMPGIGFGKALLLAVVFAAVIVILSTTGLGALLFTLLPLAALFIVCRPPRARRSIGQQRREVAHSASVG
ncbi:MAG: hypothetical protein H0U91_04535 [Rubrobacter sp.]|nr:hypothetical protein [Rubrobacter sp.]MDQ3360772.1 hypothetical protein [Actinomycetota bacterium]